MIDLTVSGAGPAGLFTALFARAAGLTVRVIDPRSAPIGKACGEGLMPGAAELLSSLGLRPGVELPGQRYYGIAYLEGDLRAEARFQGATGWGVRRDILQESMYRLAQDRGVQFVTGRVESFTQHADRVEVNGRPSRYLVAADGLHSAVRRRLGVQQSVSSAPRWGLTRHLKVAPWSDCVEVHWGRSAEVYVTPIGEQEVSVAVLTGDRAGFEQQLAGFPGLARLLAGAGAPTESWSGPVRGAGPLRQRVSRRVVGRVLLVGDAAGYVDALTGQGIETAGATARALVNCLVTDRPVDYEHAWLRATRRYRWITGALLRARRHELVRSRLVPAATRFPAVFGAAVHQLTG